MDRLDVLGRPASRRLLLVVLVVSAIALGGCRTSNVLPSVPAVVASVEPFASSGGTATPEASISGPPPPASTPTSAPNASMSSEPLQKSATTLNGGARVTIDLDRNSMPAGVPTWITTTVANLGDEPIFWVSDWDAAVWVSGPAVGAPWRAGLRQPEPLNTWKAYLLDREGIGGADRVVQFQPKSFVDRGGGACSEVAHIHGLKVDETIVQRARWDGLAFDRLSPPPTGAVDLVGRFVYGPSEDSMPTSTTEVHLRAGVVGGADQLLDPAEAVDIALAAPAWRHSSRDVSCGTGTRA
jgi:hypothetical protein